MNPRRNGHQAVHKALVLVAAVSGAAALVAGVEASDAIQCMGDTQGITRARSDAREFAEPWRDVSDLIFVGRFQSWEPDTTSSGGWEEGLVRCRVDSILIGYSRESVVDFRGGRRLFAASRLQPGTRILGHLTRSCTTFGASRGGFVVIGEDGALLDDCISSSESANAQRDPRPLRLQDLPAAVLREGVIDGLLAAAGGVACTYLSENESRPSAGGVWRCTETMWLVRSDDSLPAYVRFPRKANCFGLCPGLRYLLPIPRGFRGDTLLVDCCPRVLQVEGDQAVSLGVTLAELREVVVRREDGILQLAEPKWLQKVK